MKKAETCPYYDFLIIVYCIYISKVVLDFNSYTIYIYIYNVTLYYPTDAQIYRVSQEERSIFCDVLASVNSKQKCYKVH